MAQSKEETQQTFARILIRVWQITCPAASSFMFHFCYGNSNHKHVVEPTDMTDMVAMANRLTR